MSTFLWVLFWLVCLYAWPVMFVRLQNGPYIVFLCILTGIHRGFLSEVEIPNAVFWVLFTYFLVSIQPNSIGLACWVVLILHRLHLPTVQIPEIHFSPTTQIIMGWISIIIMPSLTWRLVDHMSIPAFICYVTAGVLMRHTMYGYNEDFNWAWACAWGLLLGTLRVTVPPHMPWGWYLFWMPFILLLGVEMRPDRSAGWFVLWDVVILVSRMVGYAFYVFYFRTTFLDRMFPFNFFSHIWRTSDPKWYPVNERRVDPEPKLCQRCHELTSGSTLIMGTVAYLTKLVEWHDLRISLFVLRSDAKAAARFTSAMENTSISIDLPSSSSNNNTTCHLCTVLWYSLSARRRQMLEMLTDSTSPPTVPMPRDIASSLRVKIWQERPLSLFTYAQLYWGELAIGARLLVHRGDLFAKPSDAISSSQMGTPEQFEQATEWLKNCRDCHRSCGSTGEDLPTRLIWVQTVENPQADDPPLTLRLINSIDLNREEEPKVEYLAFSHCWGPPGEMKFCTTPENVDANYQRIDFHALSKNMQDAVTITARLGFSYVWIDSLCIIQGRDPVAVADWRAEAGRMAAVYTNAVCTIASTAAASSAGGCFHTRNPLALQPCKIGVSSPTDPSPQWIYARCDDVFDVERSVDRAPLNVRAWVLQERLLSRRVMHFGAHMIYWECCQRAASELNPLGYEYKLWPEDFKDNYFPEMLRAITTRTELELAEQDGEGLSWAGREMVKRRPPPVELDPDLPRESQTIWQRRRGFWKNVLKVSKEPWSKDISSPSVTASLTQAGFRAAFERLRSGKKDYPMVGQGSSTQLWYEIVEGYSRCFLTYPTDKLVALAGIQKEVERAMGWKYMFGLWKEDLLLNLLWFAAEKPGRRLLATKTTEGREVTMPVAPTWSWASIEGAVAVDLLPENSHTEITVKSTLVVVINDDISMTGPEFALTLHGPVLRIAQPDVDDATGMWNVRIRKGKAVIARLFPDVVGDGVGAIHEGDELACLSFLVLKRAKHGVVKASKEDVQGLVIRRRGAIDRSYAAMPRDEESATGNLEVDERTPLITRNDWTWERVGYFTTSYIARSRGSRNGMRALEGARREIVLLSGRGP